MRKRVRPATLLKGWICAYLIAMFILVATGARAKGPGQLRTGGAGRLTCPTSTP